MPKQLLKSKEVAQLLNVGLSTLYQWRREGAGPRAVKIGSMYRYDPVEVDRYMREGSESVTPPNSAAGGS